MGFIRALPVITAAIIGLAALATDANAQAAQRIRGEVQSVNGNTLTVKTPDGKTVDVVMDDNYRVTHATKATLADIKKGDFVGSGALPDGDGWKALEVHIFPAGARNGEGHGPWAPGAAEGGTMTNAEVTASVVNAATGQLTLNTGGKDFKINVPPETPIARNEPGTKDLVKKGAWVGISNAVEKNGKLTAPNLTVSDDRRYPPR